MFLTSLLNAAVLKVGVVGGICVGGYYAYSAIKSPIDAVSSSAAVTEKDHVYLIVEYLEASARTVDNGKKLIDESSPQKASNFHCKVTSAQADTTCALYKLNSGETQNKTLTLPKNKFEDKDKIVDQSELVKGKHYVMKLDKTIHTLLNRQAAHDDKTNKAIRPEREINLIDATDPSKSFGRMKRIVHFSNVSNRNLDAQKIDTFVARVLSKETTLDPKINEYKCKFTLSQQLYPCTIHKFKTEPTSNNFDQTTLNNIELVAANDSKIAKDVFLVVRLKNPQDAMPFGSLKNQTIEVQIASGAKEKQFTLAYDQAVFGMIKTNWQMLFPLTPNKKSFLVSKVTTASVGGAGGVPGGVGGGPGGVGGGAGGVGTTPGTATPKTVKDENLNVTAKNYRCKYSPKSSGTSKIDNYDDTCILSKITAKDTNKQIFNIADIKNSLTVTDNQSFKLKDNTDQYLLLEVDGNKIYNIPSIDAEETNIEVEFAPITGADTATFGSVKIEHDITGDKTKGGKTQYLLAQVTKATTLTIAPTDKCKWTETDKESFTCDFFSLSAADETNIQKLQFSTSKVTTGSHTFKQDAYYMIKLTNAGGKTLTELNKKEIIYFNAPTNPPADSTTSTEIKLKIISLMQGSEESGKRLFYI